MEENGMQKELKLNAKEAEWNGNEGLLMLPMSMFKSHGSDTRPHALASILDAATIAAMVVPSSSP